MKTPPAALLPLIAVAAELRAAGAAWDRVGAEVHRSPETCRRWPGEYPGAWAEAFHRGAGWVIADAGAEALLTLRNLLRSADERVRLLAAKTVLDAYLALRKGQAADLPDGFVCPADLDPKLLHEALRVVTLIRDAYHARHDPAAPAGPDRPGSPLALPPAAGRP